MHIKSDVILDGILTRSQVAEQRLSSVRIQEEAAIRKTSLILYLIDDRNHGIMSGGKNKNNTMQGVLRWENILEQMGSVEKQI